MLREEGRGHDKAGAGDEQGQEELLQVLQLVERILLLLCRAQHYPRYKCPQLCRQPLRMPGELLSINLVTTILSILKQIHDVK